MSGFRFTVAAIAILLGAGAANAADLAPIPPNAAPGGPWSEVWSGVDVQNYNTFGYAGGTFSFNHNLYGNGLLFRIEGGDGEYSYLRTSSSTQTVNFQSGSAMLGYRMAIGGAQLTGYVGAYVENDANSDPLAVVKGTKWGFKGQGEAYIPLNQNWYAYVLGFYATPWNTYDVIGRVGFRATPVLAFGPEGMLLHDDRYEWDRAGGFASFNITSAIQMILSAGYSWDQTKTSLNDASGAYGTVHLRAVF